MTADVAATALAAAVIAGAATRLLARIRLAAPPTALMRTNVSGRLVPAVLGGPLALGALVGMGFVLAVGASGWDAAAVGPTGAAVALAIVVMFAAGAWDDRTGADAARGFSGHLGAARSGRITGGVVKIVAGGAVGVATGVVFERDAATVVGVALVVALSANLINLLDRAPGRAGKVALAVAAPLVAFGAPEWTVAAGPVIGSVGATLPADLKERAMLGDAGANPVGAVIGIGIAAAFGAVGLWISAAVLVALNAASERWSFSRAIERTPWLRALDRLGRRP